MIFLSGRRVSPWAGGRCRGSGRTLSHSGRLAPKPRHSRRRRTQVEQCPWSLGCSSHFWRGIRSCGGYDRDATANLPADPAGIAARLGADGTLCLGRSGPLGGGRGSGDERRGGLWDGGHVVGGGWGNGSQAMEGRI